MSQATLQAVWHAAKDGCMTPWEQMRAKAYREILEEFHPGRNLQIIADRINLKGGRNPTKEGIRRFFGYSFSRREQNWLFCICCVVVADPIVVTVDLQAKWNSADAWVAENCLEISLDGPSWVQ